MICRANERSISSGSSISRNAIVKRPQIRHDLLFKFTRQKSQSFAGFHGWSGQNDARDLFLSQRGHGHRYRKIRFAGASRSDSKNDVVFLDCFDIIALPSVIAP